jgi:predicted GNAT superfamily acetyltransferase
VTGDPGDFQIRPLESLEDYRKCVALQERVWGEGFSERVPVAILKVSQRVGGLAAGAFDAKGELGGFVFGMVGLEEGRPVHWSDMLAVRPGLRGAGLGVRLKAFQREVLLGRGVRTVYWTFDPLESRNAYVNLARLGAVAVDYVEDMYGQTDSPLHQDIGTDRLVIRWELDSPRVRRRMDGDEEPPGAEILEGVPGALAARREGGRLRPADSDPAPDASRVRVPIPAEIQSLKAEDPESAREWREATRRVLGPRLRGGWEARELVRRGNLSEYLLVRSRE